MRLHPINNPWVGTRAGWVRGFLIFSKKLSELGKFCSRPPRLPRKIKSKEMLGIALCRAFQVEGLPPLPSKVFQKLSLEEQGTHCTLGVAQSGKVICFWNWGRGVSGIVYMCMCRLLARSCMLPRRSRTKLPDTIYNEVQ